MEKRTKGKLLRVWFVCGLCLCALLAMKWIFLADAAPRLRLLEGMDCVSGGKPVLVCRMVNRSARWLYYGGDYYVERWNEDASAWENYKESSWDVNHDLGLRAVGPFAAETDEYPVWVYADPFAPGKYRMVKQVYRGKSWDAEEKEYTTLYCEFTITEK